MRAALGHPTRSVEAIEILITFFILKLTFDSLLNECNRLVDEGFSEEQIRILKSRLGKLNLHYENGIIDEERYGKNELKMMRDLNNVLEEKKGGNSRIKQK